MVFLYQRNVTSWTFALIVRPQDHANLVNPIYSNATSPSYLYQKRTKVIKEKRKSYKKKNKNEREEGTEKVAFVF